MKKAILTLLVFMTTTATVYASWKDANKEAPAKGSPVEFLFNIIKNSESLTEDQYKDLYSENASHYSDDFKATKTAWGKINWEGKLKYKQFDLGNGLYKVAVKLKTTERYYNATLHLKKFEGVWKFAHPVQDK